MAKVGSGWRGGKGGTRNGDMITTLPCRARKKSAWAPISKVWGSDRSGETEQVNLMLKRKTGILTLTMMAIMMIMRIIIFVFVSSVKTLMRMLKVVLFCWSARYVCFMNSLAAPILQDGGRLLTKHFLAFFCVNSWKGKFVTGKHSGSASKEPRLGVFRSICWKWGILLNRIPPLVPALEDALSCGRESSRIFDNISAPVPVLEEELLCGRGSRKNIPALVQARGMQLFLFENQSDSSSCASAEGTSAWDYRRIFLLSCNSLKIKCMCMGLSSYERLEVI